MKQLRRPHSRWGAKVIVTFYISTRLPLFWNGWLIQSAVLYAQREPTQ
jgi:hypothetical protein